VEGKDIGSCVGKLREVTFGSFDHEVYVEGPVSDPAECPYYGCAESKVGNEMPVHYIDVQPLGTTRHGALHLFT
jgi:hypothetical protein